MHDGYWINYRTGATFPMPEHETWIRDPKNAKKLGVPASVISLASKVKNREKYLLVLMAHAPIMRVRGHGADVAFEFNSRNRNMVMDAIWTWGKENAGPFTWMNIVNFGTGENTQMSFEEFDNQMDSGGAEAVLRVAKSNRKISVRSSIARELLEISKQLVGKSIMVLSIMLVACIHHR